MLAELGLDLTQLAGVVVRLSDIQSMAPSDPISVKFFDGALPVRGTRETRLWQEVDVEIEVTMSSPVQ